MSSRIEQIIEEIEEYVDSCKFQPLSSTKIVVNKEELEELLRELRMKTPDEIKRYQKIISNKDAILADAQSKADAIVAEAREKTQSMVTESEIMREATEQANDLLERTNQQAQEILGLVDGGDLETLRLLMGHSDLQVTMMYQMCIRDRVIPVKHFVKKQPAEYHFTSYCCGKEHIRC